MGERETQELIQRGLKELQMMKVSRARWSVEREGVVWGERCDGAAAGSDPCAVLLLKWDADRS